MVVGPAVSSGADLGWAGIQGSIEQMLQCTEAGDCDFFETARRERRDSLCRDDWECRLQRHEWMPGPSPRSSR